MAAVSHGNKQVEKLNIKSADKLRNQIQKQEQTDEKQVIEDKDMLPKDHNYQVDELLRYSRIHHSIKLRIER